MRTESALAPDVIVAGARSGRRRGDAVAVVVLVALPAVIFGLPALLGHAVLPGDDLTQNLPLRVLAGREIRAGHLPLFDPYIWSGAPLLAGWNAAAAYPLTWLFAILPGTAAWTVNMIATWAVAGLGMFCFLRALRLASLASLLGAFSFAFAGGMSAQVTHFGLVAGMSWVPLALLSILRLSQDRPMASRPGRSAGRAGRSVGRSVGAGEAGLAQPGRCGWTAVLAVAIGLMILAGEPRAIDDACVIVLLYGAWQVARLGRRAGPAVVSVSAGLALGLCLGAVQWLPGLAAISSSQRGADSMALYSSGSLPVRWVLLTLVPDLLGGSGSLGQPSFFGFYNLTEVTSYVGILPLVAAFALLGRLRWRPRPPDWLVWHVMALAGVALALGGNTPLGDLLYHLPLFGDQRLQSRNILVLDLALAVLLAYWADQPFWVVSASGGERARRLPRETVLGLVPPLAAVAAVALALHLGSGLDSLGGTGHQPQRQHRRPAEALAAPVRGARRGRGRARDLRAAPAAEAELTPDRGFRAARRAGVHHRVRGRDRARGAQRRLRRPGGRRGRLPYLRGRLARRRVRLPHRRGGPDHDRCGHGFGSAAPGRGARLSRPVRDLRP